MSKPRKAKIIILMLVGILAGSLLASSAVLALDTGIEYGQATGLSTQDIRITAMNIVRVILGFLGIIALIIIIYGGYVWMTSAGSAEKIENAKKILQNAAIGLVIILFSFAIASFIINQLGETTGVCQECSPPGSTEYCFTSGSCPHYRTCQGNGCFGSCHPDTSHPGCISYLTYYPNIHITTNQICQSQQSRIEAYVTDQDSASAQVNFFYSNITSEESGQIGGPFLITDFSQPIYSDDWDTAAFNIGDQVRVTVSAVDPNNNHSSKIKDYNIVAGHCCNGVMDADEEGIDCGGANCLACAGANCDLGDSDPLVCLTPSDNLCYSNYCNPDSCLCENRPIIYWILENNGAVGNLVTIGGLNFGQSRGEVWFKGNNGDVEARLAGEVNPNCDSSWTNNRIIVEVPAGAVSGPIRVVSGLLSDQTDDDFGPLIADFEVNSIVRPGLCKIENINTLSPQGEFGDPVKAYGLNFTDSSRVYFATVPASGGPTSISEGGTVMENFNVALVSPSRVGVRAEEAGEFSNPLNFQVNPSAQQPIIHDFIPKSGAAGTYVTISGGNLGSHRNLATDKIYFGTTEAEYNFPEECQQSYWSNGQIIVKVPQGISDGDYVISIETSTGRNDTSGLDPSVFRVDSSQIRPNICAIVPDNGPTGSAIRIYGEDSSFIGINQINFHPDSTTDDIGITGNSINTRVATGAITGPVSVQNNLGNISNSLNFTVGVCSPGFCPPGQECCQTGQYQGSCMPAGSCFGTVTDTSYLWSFTTGLKPGPCSRDIGICEPDNTLCPQGYICDDITCECRQAPQFECSTQPYPVCDPSDTLCPQGYFCDSSCTCQEGEFECSTDPFECKPDQNVCKNKLGVNSYCDISCQCKVGIPCDNEPSTPACSPNDNICKQVDPSLICDPSSCLCVSGQTANEASYIWSFNSFSYGPMVVDECNRRPDCAKVCALDRNISCANDSDCGENGPCIKAFSSPMPKWPRDGAVHINSIISASFTEKIQNWTVMNQDGKATDNIIVQICNNANEIFNADFCSSVDISNWQMSIFLWNYSTKESKGFNLIPSQDFAPNTWYRVILTNGIIGENGYPLAGLNYSTNPATLPNAYAWTFKTLASSNYGDIGCVSCQPGRTTLYVQYDGGCEEGDLDCQNYIGSGWDQDIVCVVLNPNNYQWNWSLPTENNHSADPRASIWNETTPQNPVPLDSPILSRFNSINEIITYARRDTIPTDWVNVDVKVPGLDSRAYQYNENICDLHIDLTTPVVVKRWPDCAAACLNSRVGAAFSRSMDSSTITSGGSGDSLILYACGNNPDCRPGYGVCDDGRLCSPFDQCSDQSSCQFLNYDPTPILLNMDGGVPLTINGWANAYVADPLCWCLDSGVSFENCPPPQQYCLLPNTYYRAILHDSITSNEGKPLGRLNYRDVLRQSQGLGEIDSHSWIFKTSSNMCLPDRVNVNPNLNYMDIGEIDNYSASAYAAPDPCDPQGQPLIPSSFIWQWQSTNCHVADLLSNIPSLGYLNIHDFDEIPPTCQQTSDYSNLRSTCGNGVIDPGEDCDDGNINSGDGCSGINSQYWPDGVTGACQNEGTSSCSPTLTTNCCGNGIVELGEDCDDGNSEDGDGCSSRCLWEGNTNTFSVCGNSIVEPGETCDNGRLGNDSDGCTDICLKSGSISGKSICGDGIIGLGEECDGNELRYGQTPVSGDGCTGIDYDFDSDHDPNSSLVGYWKFDDLQNIGLDSSGLGNNGEVRGDFTCSLEFGLIESGCLFSEKNQYLDIRSVDNNINPRSGTISAWAYPTGNRTNTYVVQGVSFNYDRYYIQWDNNSFIVTRGNPHASVVLASNVEYNKWYHVVISWDENRVYGYLNGELKGSVEYTSPYNIDPKFRIGSQDSPNFVENRTFPGYIDEIRFYGEKLTDSGIKMIYNQIMNPISRCSEFTTEAECKRIDLNNPANSNYKWCYWTGNVCQFRQCLNEYDTNSGSMGYGQPICGNGIVEYGEECDYGSLCQNTYGGVSACTMKNASSVCQNGACGQGVCRAAETQTGWIVCAHNTSDDRCQNGQCSGVEMNEQYGHCGSNCLRTGSQGNDRSRQRVEALYDGETQIQAWTTIAPNILGFGNLFVGNYIPDGMFGIIERWPDCDWACLNADLGGRFNLPVDSNTIEKTSYSFNLDQDNIFLYFCGRDPECSIQGKEPIGIRVVADIINQNLANPFLADSFRIYLPAWYNPVDHDQNPRTPPVPSLIPNSYYRVVVRNRVQSNNGQYMDWQINFNDPYYQSVVDIPDYTVGSPNSHSWVFKTQSENNFCGLERVEINPKSAYIREGGLRMRYFSQPFSEPDQCNSRGQRLNAFFFDWRWDDVEVTEDLNYPGGANIKTYISGEWGNLFDNASNWSNLADGCGNGIIDPGEDCDPGLFGSIPGCGSDCLWTGTQPCATPNSQNCCGNKRIDSGEDCELYTESLVAYYNFQLIQDDTIWDFAQNNNASYFNLETRNGYSGNSAYFFNNSEDGYSRVEVNNENVKPKGAFTVSAWVKSTKISMDDNSGWGIVATTYDCGWDGSICATQKGWNLGNEYGTDNKFSFFVFNNNKDRFEVFIDNFYSPSFGGGYQDQWVHVAGVFQPNNSISLYINGQKVGSRAINFSQIDYSNVPLRLGLRADNENQGRWKGDIDEFKLFNKALTDDEIVALYNDNYCSFNCRLSGNTNYNVAVCGNGIIEGDEACDTGRLGDDSDGCTDICTLSGAVMGTGSLCGDGFIGTGEGCDLGELITGKALVSGNSCSGISNPPEIQDLKYEIVILSDVSSSMNYCMDGSYSYTSYCDLNSDEIINPTEKNSGNMCLSPRKVTCDQGIECIVDGRTCDDLSRRIHYLKDALPDAITSLYNLGNDVRIGLIRYSGSLHGSNETPRPEARSHLVDTAYWESACSEGSNIGLSCVDNNECSICFDSVGTQKTCAWSGNCLSNLTTGLNCLNSLCLVDRLPDILSMVDIYGASGGTYIAGAISSAENILLGRKEANKIRIVIVMSDGAAMDVDGSAFNTLKNDGVLVYSLVFGEGNVTDSESWSSNPLSCTGCTYSEQCPYCYSDELDISILYDGVVDEISGLSECSYFQFKPTVDCSSLSTQNECEAIDFSNRYKSNMTWCYWSGNSCNSRPCLSEGRIDIWGQTGKFYNYNPSPKKWFNINRSTISSDGLPSDFIPTVGYYHPFGGDGGRVSLWNASGQLFVYNPTSKIWNNRTGSQTSIGLPSDFIPTVGYYHPFGSGCGRIVLWDNTGKLYIYNPNQNEWESYTGSQTSIGLPADFIPTVGYYHPFGSGNGRVVLWNRSGQLYIYNPNQNKWEDHTNNQTSLGLPSGFIPTVGYYHPFGGVVSGQTIPGRIELWDANGTVCIFPNNQGRWSCDSDYGRNSFSGPGFIPTVGYYHPFQNYGGEVYWNSSSCGNGVIEPGETCDNGGWCLDVNNNWIHCYTNRNSGCASACLPYSGFCSIDLTPSNALIGSNCNISGTCQQRHGGYFCIVGNSIAYSNPACSSSTVGNSCTVGGGEIISSGCSTQCTNAGSAVKDNLIDPYQIVESVMQIPDIGLFEVKEEIRAWSNLQPDRAGAGELTIIGSARIPFKVIGHQPKPDAQNQCRNVGIWAVFSRQLDADTIKDNFKVCPAGSTNCQNDNMVESFSYKSVLGSCRQNQCYYSMSDNPLAPLENSFCQYDSDCLGSQVMVTKLDTPTGFLEGLQSYRIDVTGIKSVPLDETGQGEILGHYNWEFNTSNDFCRCDHIGVVIDNTSGGEQTTRDVFTCAGDDCGKQTATILDDDVDPGMSGNQHLYNTTCYDITNEQAEIMPLSPIGLEFSWDRFDPDGLISLAQCESSSIPNVIENCIENYNNKHYVTPNSKNGKSEVRILADQYILFDFSAFCDPTSQNTPRYVCQGTTDECNPQNHTCSGDCVGYCKPLYTKETTVNVINFICDNPWPPTDKFPYRDQDNFVMPNTNFELQYCRDFGESGFDDDLPALSLSELAIAGRPGGNVLKEIIFPVGDFEASLLERKYGVDLQGQYCLDLPSPYPLQKIDNVAYCNRGNSRWEYRFNITSENQGNYILKINSFNRGAELAYVNYCDINNDGILKSADNETIPCNPNEANPCIQGVCMKGITHVIEVYAKKSNENWPEVGAQNRIGIISNFASKLEVSGEINLGYFSEGDWDIRLRWINDWNHSDRGLDSNLAISRVELHKVAGDIQTGDAIGVRVIKNPLHLSPETWYRSGLCGGNARFENLCFSDNDCRKVDDNSLLLYWPFGETSGSVINDASFYDNHGKMKTHTTSDLEQEIKWFTGRFGNGIRLEPSNKDFIQSDSNNINFGDTGQFTYAAWIKLASLPSSGQEMVVISKIESDSRKYQLLLSAPGGNLGIAVGINGQVAHFPLNEVTAGQWYNLALTYDQNVGANLYLDGERRFVYNFAEGHRNIADFSAPIIVGRNNSASGYFDGVIDDVRVYNRALSAEEIRALAEAKEWNCVMNVPTSSGSGQSAVIDGYKAVIDGRTVYVGATNRDQNSLYSNIYLLSYNQDASSATREIFKRILDQTGQLGKWYFNTNFTNHRVCQSGHYEGTDISCQADWIGRAYNCSVYSTGQSCASNEARVNGCYWVAEANRCFGRICMPNYCLSDFDCPDLLCNANKEKVVRDSIRHGDLRDIQITLERHTGQKGQYPNLRAGTYIENTIFSNWASWQQTLGAALGVSLYTDPLNLFKGCGSDYFCDYNKNGKIDSNENESCTLGEIAACNNQPHLCLPANPDFEQTCWNELEKRFSCPQDMFVYAYQSAPDGSSYNLFTNMEYEGPGNWRTASLPNLYQLPISFVQGPACESLNFEVKKATFAGGTTPVECLQKFCWGGGIAGDNNYGNGSVPCNTDTDCSVGGYRAFCTGDRDADGICDVEDNCDPRSHCTNPADCYNPDQKDSGNLGIGDVCNLGCSGDMDNDGVCDEVDNCPTVWNPIGQDCRHPNNVNIYGDTGQCDYDGDGYGDACDPCTDYDGDGFWDFDTGANDESICPQDNCKPYYNECREPEMAGQHICFNSSQADWDNDGIGNICDSCLDFDGDGFGDYTFFTGSIGDFSPAVEKTKQWDISVYNTGVIDLESITYGNNKFVALSSTQNKALISNSGVSWAIHNVPTGDWQSIAYGNDKFVALDYVGSDKSIFSDDGISWIVQNRPFLGCRSMVYGQDKFIAVSNIFSKALISDDGISWSIRDIPGSVGWKSITYGQDKFMAVSNENNKVVVFKNDGVIIVYSSMPDEGNWQSMAYGNGKFVAVSSSNNKVAISDSGTVWHVHNMPDSRWGLITYGDGKFVAVSNTNRKVAISSDGVSWISYDIPGFNSSFKSITYGDGKFVAVGQSGRVMVIKENEIITGYRINNQVWDVSLWQSYFAGCQGDPNEFIGRSNGPMAYSENLIGYWKLDNSLIDLSGNANTAIAQGGINCTNNLGYIGFGCTFGQADRYLDISSVKSLVNPKQGSISVWAYPTEIVGSNRYIIEGMGPSTDRYYIRFDNSSLKIIRGNTGATVTLLNNVELNKWYHIVMSWDENNIYGYINGDFKEQKQYNSVHGDPSRFNIGIQIASDNRSFPGHIDEVAFFNRRLTDQEVKEIYWYMHPETDLDNCPGGPYGAVCRDEFGIQISCYNPSEPRWVDWYGNVHYATQKDHTLNNRGDICDSFGSGILEGDTECDCTFNWARLTFWSGIEPNRHECVTINNFECTPGPMANDECWWCYNGKWQRVITLGFGDGVINFDEDCDCGYDETLYQEGGTFQPDGQDWICTSPNNVECGDGNYQPDCCQFCKSPGTIHTGRNGGCCGDGIVQKDAGEECDRPRHGADGCVDCRALPGYECDPDLNVCVDCTVNINDSLNWLCSPSIPYCGHPAPGCDAKVTLTCSYVGEFREDLCKQVQELSDVPCHSPPFPYNNGCCLREYGENSSNEEACGFLYGEAITIKAADTIERGLQKYFAKVDESDQNRISFSVEDSSFSPDSRHKMVILPSSERPDGIEREIRRMNYADPATGSTISDPIVSGDIVNIKFTGDFDNYYLSRMGKGDGNESTELDLIAKQKSSPEAWETFRIEKIHGYPGDEIARGDVFSLSGYFTADTKGICASRKWWRVWTCIWGNDWKRTFIYWDSDNHEYMFLGRNSWDAPGESVIACNENAECGKTLSCTTPGHYFCGTECRFSYCSNDWDCAPSLRIDNPILCHPDKNPGCCPATCENPRTGCGAQCIFEIIPIKRQEEGYCIRNRTDGCCVLEPLPGQPTCSWETSSPHFDIDCLCLDRPTPDNHKNWKRLPVCENNIDIPCNSSNDCADAGVSGNCLGPTAVGPAPCSPGCSNVMSWFYRDLDNSGKFEEDKDCKWKMEEPCKNTPHDGCCRKVCSNNSKICHSDSECGVGNRCIYQENFNDEYACPLTSGVEAALWSRGAEALWASIDDPDGNKPFFEVPAWWHINTRPKVPRIEGSLLSLREDGSNWRMNRYQLMNGSGGLARFYFLALNNNNQVDENRRGKELNYGDKVIISENSVGTGRVLSNYPCSIFSFDSCLARNKDIIRFLSVGSSDTNIKYWQLCSSINMSTGNCTKTGGTCNGDCDGWRNKCSMGICQGSGPIYAGHSVYLRGIRTDGRYDNYYIKLEGHGGTGWLQGKIMTDFIPNEYDSGNSVDYLNTICNKYGWCSTNNPRIDDIVYWGKYPGWR